MDSLVEGTWEEFVDAYGSGWVVVFTLSATAKKSKRKRIFVNVCGPYPDKKSAKKDAAKERRRAKSHPEEFKSNVELISISVRPLWKIEPVGVK